VTTKQTVFLLRLATLIGLFLPALDLAWRWYNDELGARPVTEATLITGDWTVIFLLTSLAMTPARATFEWAPLVQIRRRIGVAAALYASAHFLIFVFDQKWNLLVVAAEIIKRFYLTIGFVALVMLLALAITSTNGWQRRLKRNWKRLHWLVYPAAVLALLHFFIQSKVIRPVRLADDLAIDAATAAHAVSRAAAARHCRDAGGRGLRGRLVRPGEQGRPAAGPGGRPRSRSAAPARAQGPDRVARRGPSGRPAPPAETPLDEALYPADYIDLLKRQGESEWPSFLVPSAFLDFHRPK
jgi:DMSO/TMAO reductase YedYZ heme-binding membrane subunit